LTSAAAGRAKAAGGNVLIVSGGGCYHSPPMADEITPETKSHESLLSLNRLREAFAAMLDPGSDKRETEGEVGTGTLAPRSPQLAPSCEINPRSVVEAILFVGRPDSGSLSSRQLAAAMRGVTPREIEAAVAELNALYEADGAPYIIEGTRTGYRLVLRERYGRLRDKFYGNVREAKLSPAALEVLAIVAYHQPVTLDQMNAYRNAANGGALATLVRRGLVRLDRPAVAGAKPQYSTTDRFLKLFALESLDALPRSEELGKL
jgi:segregation and condensation protein B